MKIKWDRQNKEREGNWDAEGWGWGNCWRRVLQAGRSGEQEIRPRELAGNGQISNLYLRWSFTSPQQLVTKVQMAVRTTSLCALRRPLERRASWSTPCAQYPGLTGGSLSPSETFTHETVKPENTSSRAINSSLTPRLMFISLVK